MELMIHRVCVMKPYHGVARRALWLGARGRAGGGGAVHGGKPTHLLQPDVHLCPLLYILRRNSEQ